MTATSPLTTPSLSSKSAPAPATTLSSLPRNIKPIKSQLSTTTGACWISPKPFLLPDGSILWFDHHLVAFRTDQRFNSPFLTEHADLFYLPSLEQGHEVYKRYHGNRYRNHYTTDSCAFENPSVVRWDLYKYIQKLKKGK